MQESVPSPSSIGALLSQMQALSRRQVEDQVKGRVIVKTQAHEEDVLVVLVEMTRVDVEDGL